MHGAGQGRELTVFPWTRRRAVRPGDRACAPTCGASCCGQTHPVGERTGSRSARSSSLIPGRSPPGLAGHERPAPRWPRSPGSAPAAWCATGPRQQLRGRCGLDPEPFHESLQRVPREPDRTVIALTCGKHVDRIALIGCPYQQLFFSLVDLLHLLRGEPAARLRPRVPARGQGVGRSGCTGIR